MATERACIAVVGHGPELEREGGAAPILRSLGAEVRTFDLWDAPSSGNLRDPVRLRVLLIEALDRPDLGAAALRSWRKHPASEGVGAIIAVTVAQVSRIEPTLGFDDFVLAPYVPAELYARVRAIEWAKSEFSAYDRLKIGAIVVDKAAHEVHVGGQPIELTAKELALLTYLCERRGRVFSREHLLEHVWGKAYEGGTRTVDIHVRRLRQKLGAELPLETVRGSGYKLRPP